jgi:hypothetical protein
MCAWLVQAQDREVEDKDDIFSKVRIDTIQIKATPYERVLENGVWKDEDKQIDYYNDITIYEISKKESGQPSALMTGPKSAIFMLLGGGFFGHARVDTVGMSADRPANITLGSKFVANDTLNAKVFMVYYHVNPSPLIEKVVVPINAQNCSNKQNETGRALLEEASYKAFYDLRKILKNHYDSASVKGLDTNNFFLIGSSAGSVLIHNTLFLVKEEIPDTIYYKPNCTGNTNFIAKIPINTSTIKNMYWPIPPLKGVVPMAGAWIYDSIKLVQNNNPKLLSTNIFMIHGTCDELISRYTDIIGFKNPDNLFSLKNPGSPSRFIRGFGSTSIFKSLMNTHGKLGYAMVKLGGHSIFNDSSSANPIPPIGNLGLGAWDYLTGNKNNSSASITTFVVYSQISPFLKGLITGSSNWTTKTSTFDPSRATVYCRTFDYVEDTVIYCSIGNPVLNLNDTLLCSSSTRTASITGANPLSTFNWTHTGNVQILSGQGTSTITYIRTSASNSTGSISVTVSRACAQQPVTLSRSISTFSDYATIPSTINFSSAQTIVSPICSQTITSVITTNLPTSITRNWTKSGNIVIVSQTATSVTYKRDLAISSSGNLILTLSTPCETKIFTYPIVTQGSIGQGWTFNANPIIISNICGVTISSLTTEPIPPSETSVFSILVNNAASLGITSMEWEFSCGTITSGPVNTWSGNNLYSEVTVMSSASACTNIRVRAVNSCGAGSWRTQNLSLASCSGFMMMLYPNPASTMIQVELKNEDNIEAIASLMDLMVVDIQGQPVINTKIQYGRADLDVSKLKEGQYKVIVNTSESILYGTFNISR